MLRKLLPAFFFLSLLFCDSALALGVDAWGNPLPFPIEHVPSSPGGNVACTKVFDIHGLTDFYPRSTAEYRCRTSGDAERLCRLHKGAFAGYRGLVCGSFTSSSDPLESRMQGDYGSYRVGDVIAYAYSSNYYGYGNRIWWLTTHYWYYAILPSERYRAGLSGTNLYSVAADFLSLQEHEYSHYYPSNISYLYNVIPPIMQVYTFDVVGPPSASVYSFGGFASNCIIGCKADLAAKKTAIQSEASGLLSLSTSPVTGLSCDTSQSIGICMSGKEAYFQPMANGVLFMSSIASFLIVTNRKKKK